MVEQTYSAALPGTVPVPGQLPFLAKSVIINSGSNYVSSKSLSFPAVPPNVSGFQINLAYPSNLPDFAITAPPPGTAPVGPVEQIYSSLTYSDQELPFAPGIVTQQQQVVVITDFFGANVPTEILPGLARAATVYIGTQDNLAHNITVFGTDPALGPSFQALLYFLNSQNVRVAFGEGTVGFLVAAPTTQFTDHLWPVIGFYVDSPYFFNARFYY